jgi:hypothetical protein
MKYKLNDPLENYHISVSDAHTKFRENWAVGTKIYGGHARSRLGAFFSNWLHP